MSARAHQDLVLVSVEERVATLTLNRPDMLNAFNLEMAREFLSALEALGREPDVRAVVLRGSGKIFSAGGDIREMIRDVRRGDDPAAYFRAPLSAFGEMVLAVRRTPRPVIAAVHGAAAGVAFNLVLACDLRIATESSRFTQAFIKIGVSPDGGGTWFLPRIVGAARAAQLALLPEELDAPTARDWGILNWVVPEPEFDTRVTEIACEIARGPREAMARAKFLLNTAHERDLPTQMEMERLAQIENAMSPDFGEGLTAFLEKRKPRFV